MKAAKTLCTTLLLLGLLAAPPADARTKDGVTMPNSVTIAGKKLSLNGLGTREATVFNVNVYVAGLYLESKTSSASKVIDSDQVKHLVLKFVRDVDKDDITDAWTEGFYGNAGKRILLIRDKVKTLNSWMSDVSEGDSLIFTYVPGKGTTIKLKGKTKGTIEGEHFGNALFSVFVGKKPPNSGLKKGLLGR